MVKFSPKEYWAGGGNLKMILSYITQNLLHYLLWHIVSSHRVLLNRFQEEATP